MRALVTGATGFLGGRLTQLLCQHGANVTVLVRKGSKLSHLSHLTLKQVCGDLEDEAALAQAVAEVDYVFHCAALSGDWGTQSEFQRTNAVGTANLLRAAATVPQLRRFVHVSSTDVYGYPQIPCGEDRPALPCKLPYHRSKCEAEQAVAAQAGFMATTVVRPASIYGPRSKDFVVLMGQMLLRGEMMLLDQGRSNSGLIYVDDVAQAMIAAAQSPNTIGRSYNLCHPEVVTWRSYLDGLAQVLGSPPARISLPGRLAYAGSALLEAAYRLLPLPGRPLSTRHAVLLFTRDQQFPCARAQQDFHFAPQVDLAEGLRRIRLWLQSHEGQAALPNDAKPDAPPRPTLSDHR